MARVFLVFFVFAPTVNAIEFKLTTDVNQEVWQLNEQINTKRKEIDELKRQSDLYEKSLASKRREIATLSYQVSTINQTITKLSLEKETIELQIDEINLSIKNNQLKIQATEDQVAERKDRIGDLIRTLHRDDQNMNLLAILATNDQLSDFVDQIQHLQNVQETVLDTLGNLNTLKLALVTEKTSLDQNKVDAEKLQGELTEKAVTLEDQKDAKFSLITQTRGEESKYQQLLQDLKAEQERTNSDIVKLEQVAREKLNRQIKQGRIGTNESLQWPVDSRFVTSYFHDPDYPFRNVYEHPAIDIRTAQGTAVRAASSGYVARAKDAGMGYSYVMLVHDNGLSTVYGHVSAIYVEEGTFVTQGQAIGLSGGKPGTRGAGRLTTGPHLHFEVRLNGVPVNPLNYVAE